MDKGIVYIVGAGPGDPDLLTMKAARVIQQADIILYDNLVSRSILGLARAFCDLKYVGKICGNHELTQEQINQLLVESAQKGLIVVRLKGGDPLVFGRGGEEALALAEAQIPFEIVPGLSSALAAPAYAGVPVTHRNVASSFAVITGHEKPGKSNSQLHWPCYAGIDTLVFLMAVATRQEIAQRLIEVGRVENEPVIFIENATTPNQRVIRSSLKEVAHSPPVVLSPAIMVVGRVGDFSAVLNWFHPETQDVASKSAPATARSNDLSASPAL